MIKFEFENLHKKDRCNSFPLKAQESSSMMGDGDKKKKITWMLADEQAWSMQQTTQIKETLPQKVED